MSFLPVSSGPYNLAEYLAAPVPWVTASTVPPGVIKRHDFPYVTQNINISNVGVTGSLYVGFTQAGLAGPNYITLQPSQSVSLNTEHHHCSFGVQDQLIMKFLLVLQELNHEICHHLHHQ